MSSRTLDAVAWLALTLVTVWLLGYVLPQVFRILP